MSHLIADAHGRLMKHNSRVVLEPDLEAQVFNVDARGRRLLAKIYFRWAIQLFVSSRILERDELQQKIVRLPSA